MTGTAADTRGAAEHARLQESAWKEWGPYLGERQWGTVREDYSADGDAWDFFPHDHARSRVYRWGEDGLAGFCDEQQRICLGLALWNERDPFLKERLFGLTNEQGNHGEDVKELYYYLDGVPSHAYAKMLYKYPQAAFPYDELVRVNRERGLDAPEYELLDTGVFEDDRYFDVFVEYAQAEPGDILMLVTAHNRADTPAPLHLLPQVWFRNTWSWGRFDVAPKLERTAPKALQLRHRDFADYRFAVRDDGDFLITENETNEARIWGAENDGPVKDAFHRRLVDGEDDAAARDGLGSKAAYHLLRTIAGGESCRIGVRLSPEPVEDPFDDFDTILDDRRREADEYYHALQTGIDSRDDRRIHRQAMAGMIWSKQFYYWDIPQWLHGDPDQPDPPQERKYGRNADWDHLNNADVFSMPDKWEYPWYAAWDTAFHCVPLAIMDPDFAKSQLDLLTREWYMHPNGQLPAYEWQLDDVNPPVHAWAAWRVFEIDKAQRDDQGDLAFLESVFHKLMLNFTWWVNRKDTEGRNIFQGGFLGLDNIGLFDRSAPLPTGGHIDQSDGTSWMAMYSLNLMRISLELARHNSVYENIATKFFEHFMHIAEAMTNMGGEDIGLWDEEDGFYYDMLHLPGDTTVPLRLRSIVGLIPLFAVEVLPGSLLEEVPGFAHRLRWYLDYRPELSSLVAEWDEPGCDSCRLLSLLPGNRMRQIIERLLDEDEFFSDYGIRALSKHHEEHPYEFMWEGQKFHVEYQPGESRSRMFGGNSNWRGPIWFPLNYLVIESLLRFDTYYGDDCTVSCPTGSDRKVTLEEAAIDISQRLVDIFRLDDEGRRPVLANHPKLQSDPHFRDYVLFHEHFHGDTGRGLGASHQTGWTGLVASLIELCSREGTGPGRG